MKQGERATGTGPTFTVPPLPAGAAVMMSVRIGDGEPECAEEARNQAEMRRAAEAPLVALVKAVPEGLDPLGWRAAVLGLRERHLSNGLGAHANAATVADAAHLTVMLQRFAAAIARGELVEKAQAAATNSRCLAMTAAYASAMAPPGPRPAPERKRGGRDARLTVDDGRDNE